ncbi:unnamed protein product, partial [Meganyctiphanes norvegica]
MAPKLFVGFQIPLDTFNIHMVQICPAMVIVFLALLRPIGRIEISSKLPKNRQNDKSDPICMSTLGGYTLMPINMLNMAGFDQPNHRGQTRSRDGRDHRRWVMRMRGKQVIQISTEVHKSMKFMCINFGLVTVKNENVSFLEKSLKFGHNSAIFLKRLQLKLEVGEWNACCDALPKLCSVVNNGNALRFESNGLIIQLNRGRLIYTSELIVKNCVLWTLKQLGPFYNSIKDFGLDPSMRIMRRWPSQQTGHGVVNLDFDLAEFPQVGTWTLRVVARQQVQEKTVLVEHYFRPRFEVMVRLPHTLDASEHHIEGVVVANMTNWMQVMGNLSIHLQYSQHHYKDLPTDFITIHKYFLEQFRGYHGFRLSMDYLANQVALVNPDDDHVLTVRVLAEVTEFSGFWKQQGWANTRVIAKAAKLSFLGDEPLIFHPGMPISVHVFASYKDDHPFEDEELEDAILKVTFLPSGGGPSKVEEVTVPGFELVKNKGVADIVFDVPRTTQGIKFDAVLTTSSGLRADATLLSVPHHSPRDYHLQVDTSTYDATPGQFIILHVRHNFYVQHFSYAVMSKGVMVYSSSEPVADPSSSGITTLSVPASTEMAPAANILVWAIAPDGELVSTALAIPVNPLGRHKVGIRWSDHKDHSGGSSELKFLGEKGAFVGYSALWEETHHMDSGNDLTHARVLNHMMDLALNDTFYNITKFHLRRASTRSREGAGSKVEFYPTPMVGPDAASTFNFSDTLVLTDADIYYQHSNTDRAVKCSDTNLLPCLTGGCYQMSDRCDGTPHCPDHSDEADCALDIDPFLEYRIHRVSRVFRFYDPDVGDWGWRDVREEGLEIQVFAFPKRPQNWVLNMFAVGREFGLGLLEAPIPFDSAGPFMVTLEGPKVVRQGEQVGLRVCVSNFHNSQVGVWIRLPKSDDYRSILVEEHGRTDSYNPKTVDGEHQHVVWLEGGEHRDVHLPIVFTRMGEIDVSVYGSTQMMKDMDSITISVNAEGVSIGKHTSILLDLKNRGLTYDFLDIHLDESPIIPLSERRRFIFETTSGHISVTGDVLGPAFPSIPVNSAELLGLEAVGTSDYHAYNFAANLWTLHYLRLTNQLDKKTQYEVLKAVNVEYAAITRFQKESGGFTMWPECEPSVWLTAYIIRTLWIANFQDWEDLIYIDPVIVGNASTWLLSYQTEEGAFFETPTYLNTLDSKINPTNQYVTHHGTQHNISITAHVILAFVEILPDMQGEIRSQLNMAKKRAVSFLERQLKDLTDPYEIALVAWALTKADSGSMDEAFDYLDRIKIDQDSKIYWSREKIGFNTLVYENSQKPYIQPKDDQTWDAIAVEASSYALMVYLKREGVGMIQESIVRFLAVMREFDGGLISTLDSVAALQALVEYSYRARLRDITDMTIEIEHTADKDFNARVTLGNATTLATMQSFDLKNIWGHIAVTGHGQGQALVQLDYAYGVDYEPLLDVPPIPAFDFTVQARYSGANASHIDITTCQRWTNIDEVSASGLSVVEVHLPSGYIIMQDKLMEYVNSRKVPNLRWALRTDTYVKFFFNYLDNEETCLTYQVERWYPVSNHSRYNMARVYDLYQPERFNNTIFEVFSLYSLDICEVCGSYQVS